MKTSTIISLVNGTLLMTIVLLEYTKIIDFSLILSYQWHKILHVFGVTITGLSSVRLEITCVEYSNTGPGGILNWTGIGTSNGWQMGHVMYED